MKFLGSTIGKFEIAAFVLGFLVGIYMFIFPAKYFFTSHLLPASPEPIDKIISANLGDVIIKTVFDKKFLCNIFHEEACWVEVDYDPLSMGKILCEGDCPNTDTVQMMESTVRAHSFVAVSTRYSLNDDGVIYIKQKGVVYPAGYMMGAIIGAFCAFATYLCKYLIFTILNLLRRGRFRVT